jgi:hypothetical protein
MKLKMKLKKYFKLSNTINPFMEFPIGLHKIEKLKDNQDRAYTM